MPANDLQVGGNHYRKIDGEQHWDRAIRLNWDFFQYQITKYVERWKDKDGMQDLEKARHFLDKYIETVRAQLNYKETTDATGLERGGEVRGGERPEQAEGLPPGATTTT